MAEGSDEIVNILWEKEEIPDKESLYCYVHKQSINNKTVKPLERAFGNTPAAGDNLSSDWNKYSTPEETRARLGLQKKVGRDEFKNPLDYYIVQFSVGGIRLELRSQTIEHDPIQNALMLPDNRAHTKIIGEKDPEIRLKLVDMCQWAISPLDAIL